MLCMSWTLLLAKRWTSRMQTPRTSQTLGLRAKTSLIWIFLLQVHLLWLIQPNGTNLLAIDWDEHRSRVKLAIDRSIPLITLSYLVCFTIAHFIHHPYFSFALATIPSSFLAYTLLFRLRNLARNKFDGRVWLKAGSDVDGGGKVSEEERIKESVEWANAVLRGV